MKCTIEERHQYHLMDLSPHPSHLRRLSRRCICRTLSGFNMFQQFWRSTSKLKTVLVHFLCASAFFPFLIMSPTLSLVFFSYLSQLITAYHSLSLHHTSDPKWAKHQSPATPKSKTQPEQRWRHRVSKVINATFNSPFLSRPTHYIELPLIGCKACAMRKCSMNLSSKSLPQCSFH